MKTRKLLAVLLTLAMCLGMLPGMALASEGDVAQIGETKYETLAEAVSAAQNGDTVKLLTDTSGDGIDFAAGKNVVIDFKGYTYTITDPAVGSEGTKNQGIRTLLGSTLTLKNGMLKFDANATEFLMAVHNYGTLTLDNFDIDTTDNSRIWCALDTDCGVLTLTGDSDIKVQAGGYAVVVDYWETTNYHGVKAVFDKNYTGTVDGTLVVGSENQVLSIANKDKCVVEIAGGTFNTGAIIHYPPVLEGYNPNWGTEQTVESVNITITGGSFSSKPAANYLAANKASALTNGMWVVGAAPTATEIAATLAGNVELSVAPGDGNTLNTVANGESHEVSVNLETDKTTGKEKIIVPAKDMNAAINITVTESGVSKTQTVTVAEYLKTIIEDTTKDESVRNIAQATLDYGNAAAQYFTANGATANSGYTYTDSEKSALDDKIDDVNEDDVVDSNHKLNTTDADSSIEFIGSSLMLEGKTTIRLNFRITGAAPAYVNVTGVGNVDLKHRSGQYYYAEVAKDLAPDKFNTECEATVDDVTVRNVSVNSCIFELIKRTESIFSNRTVSDASKRLAKALYLYGQACKTT